MTSFLIGLFVLVMIVLVSGVPIALIIANKQDCKKAKRRERAKLIGARHLDETTFSSTIRIRPPR